MHLLRNSLGLILFALLLVGPPHELRAQSSPLHIQIAVVEGDGASSETRARVSHDPVIRVEDEDHRSVAGAVVVFSLPMSGASGEFLGGSKSLTIMTGDDGLAAARGLKTNDVPGKLQIYVTASFHGLRARTLINQVVAAAPGAKAPAPEVHAAKSGGKWKWILLGVAAAGGAGAAAYLLKGKANSTTPISVSTGTVVFGNPH